MAIGDVDADGLPDVFFACQSQGGSLYRNLGEFRFEEITRGAGLELEGYWATGVSMADVNNDGKLDIYLCSFGQPNRLYVNQGDGTFQEQAKSYGVDYQGACVAAAFADYDLDGRLDLYLLTNHFPLLEQVNIPLRRDDAGLPQVAKEWEQFRYIMNPPRGVAKPRIVEGAEYDVLYRNLGDGSFKDVTSESGIGQHNYHGLSATWLDYDHDGDPDLYVANDFFGPDHLYQNNGDGTFTDVVGKLLPYIPWFSMGADAADVNNDGLIDLFAADMSSTSHYREVLTMGNISTDAWFLDYAEPQQYMRNMLFVNAGVNRFLETAHYSGIDSTDWTWSVKFGDLDADGLVDLFVTNGMTRDFQNGDLKAISLALQAEGKITDPHEFWEQQPALNERNLVYQNLGQLQFGDSSSDWGLNHNGVSLGAAFGDLDRDGDLDLIVNNFDDLPTVYRNDLVNGGQQIQIQLRGAKSNHFGVGAEVRATSGDVQQIRQVVVCRGYMSSDEPIVHFGLGDAQKVDRLEIRWPSGVRQVLEGLAAGHRYTIVEPTGLSKSDEKVQPSIHRPFFVESSAADALVHRENAFDDFSQQPLLPRRLSQSGPKLAAGDIDGDGSVELFLGGAAGGTGKLFRLVDSKYVPMRSPTFNNAAPAEDTGSAFFDADDDGDLDLYVASGGVEHEAGSSHYRDRLYLNDGSGNFSRADDGALPGRTNSSSCVVPCDYDQDGDQDLFVGGRVIPGWYPETPLSALLRNDSSKAEVLFAEVTDLVAPELTKSGMVTSAVWRDVDGNGWDDLICTTEWGPVRLFLNTEGRLEEHTGEYGLAQRLGWWNGIATDDFDGDGDSDFIITNYGQNTKYHASPTAPLLLFFGDLDGSGEPHIVEAKLGMDGRQIPLRSRTVLNSVLPSIAGEFATHEAFARASVLDLFGSRLADAFQLEVNELRSGVLINQQQEGFEFRPLPMLAQLSPGFDVALLDANEDGNVDAFIAQNFYGSQREIGRLAGGCGVLLLGNGQGDFEELWPQQSGISGLDAATSIVVVDCNRDQRLDLVIAVNNRAVKAFQSAEDRR